MSKDSTKTRVVEVGNVTIGGDNPVVVQSMANTDTKDTESTLSQIRELAEIGCEIVRVAVPDMEAAEALKSIVPRSPIPLVADIHFDGRLALEALEAGIDKLRLNPGNITDLGTIQEIAIAASELSVPIRVGVNTGSLSEEVVEKYGGRTPEAMVASAREEIGILEGQGFEDIVVSLKSSDVIKTISANRLFASQFDYPLHLGVTEAGGGRRGLVKSSLGIGPLLMEGIGDTIRISLTGDPAQEVAAAYEILRALGLRSEGVDIISCPTCGRVEMDVSSIVEILEDRLADISEPIRLAVMGCVVNGIGEAGEADYGLVGTPKGALLYRGGEQFDTISSSTPEEIADKLEGLIRDDMPMDKNDKWKEKVRLDNEN